jgi:lipopolysaccharide biosynthesis glycosyltransferase
MLFMIVLIVGVHQNYIMQNKKTVAFSIADEKNLAWAKALEKSFKHFHPDIPFIIYGDKEIDETHINRPAVFYLATPYFARQLIKEYEQVVKIDADSIVTAPLEILDSPESFDVGVVGNWTRDGISDSVKVWDIQPQSYFNNGFVVFRSEEIIEHIWKLCMQSNFNNYPYREQDMLNIVCHYGNYKVKVIDHGDSWYGLQSKSHHERRTSGYSSRQGYVSKK